jgi:hypothetical protein
MEVKMKNKRITIIFIIIFSVLLSMVLISGKKDNSEKKFQISFFEKLEENRDFRLTDITSFEWDKVYVLPPYFDLDFSLDEIVGLNVYNHMDGPEFVPEHTYAFVFFKGETLAKYIEMDAKDKMFDKKILSTGMTRSSAKFKSGKDGKIDLEP